jgi:hypothetical protein
VFTYLAFDKVLSARDLDSGNMSEAEYDAKLNSVVDEGNTNFTIATIAYSAGGTVLAAGVAFLLVDMLMPEASPITVLPSVMPHQDGAAFSVHVGF